MKGTQKPQYSQATVAGHPLHPMLVGFPVAFYTATFVAFVIFAVNAEPFWYRLAFIANVAGVVMAVVAAIPGFIDWSLGIPSRTAAKRTGALHMGFNILALLMFGVNLAVSAGGWRELAPNVVAPLVFSGLGLVLTLCAGWLGWQMVQTHHVGVLPKPVTAVSPIPTMDPQAHELPRLPRRRSAV
jgi:uncharacterized membrane protein